MTNVMLLEKFDILLEHVVPIISKVNGESGAADNKGDKKLLM